MTPPSDAGSAADRRQYFQIALEEAQATVRGYDTKAQIVGIGYTFTLNIVAAVVGGLPGAAQSGIVFVLVFWSVVMAPLFLFGYVLYPSRRSVSKVPDGGAAGVRRALYVQTSRYPTVESLKAAVAEVDWEDELAYELLMVSKLREQKRARFILALAATVLSFIVLALRHIGAFLPF